MLKFDLPSVYYKNKKKYWNSTTEKNWNDYKWQLKNRINTPGQLMLFFPYLNINNINKVYSKYQFSITPYYLSLIDFNNPKDPLALQVLPDTLEIKPSKNLSFDPFNEEKKSKNEFIIQRYSDRIVLASSNKCACYCRYCTRKWMWNKNKILTNDKLENIIYFIKKNKNIREVIISGGEPFLISINLLKNIIKKVLSLPNIEVIRIHTRILTFLPQAVTESLVKMLSNYKPIWIITHFNHPDEITPITERAVDKLLNAKIALCNQSVFLKNINDNMHDFKNLVQKLESILIKPYYIFQCDHVIGTKHFHASIQKCKEIMKKIRKQTSGLCIPNFVIDSIDKGKILIY